MSKGKSLTRNKYKVLDLFSGCGGLSYGFELAGFDIVAGIDCWEDALMTFQKNHPNSKVVLADLFVDSPQKITKKINTKIDIIIGGPPCQGFSIAGKRIIDDARNQLYKSFVSFVKYYQPKVFLLENVPNIVSMGKGVAKDSIIEDFEKLGYTVVYKVLLASDYGVPQNRKRAIFVGMKNNKKFIFPERRIDIPVSAKDAISDLSEKSMADGSVYTNEPKSKYQKMIRKNSKGIYNHEITLHSEQTRNIISLVPDGGNYKDLPEEFRKTRNVNIAWTRLNSKKPSFTIDTGHRHHFHYKFNRVPTVRESARIQSFPDTFIFLGSKTSQYKQVGNAVPPILANELANEIKKYL